MDVLASELQEMAFGKAVKSQVRRQSTAGAPATPPTKGLPPSGAGAASASRPSSSLGSRPSSAMQHNRTPIPKSLAGKALLERHSISFAG